MLKYLRLGKWYIAFPVALSGFTGSILFYPYLDWLHLTVFAGILLLAMAASGINQWQERDIDPVYPRTQRRPIITGDVTVREAIIFSGILIISGSLLLLSLSVTATLTGLVTLIWYNVIYTPLKRISAFAAVPGAIVGALPPVIGWTALGGALTDSRIIALSVIFFFAQIPHFWLIVLKYRDEYLLAPHPNMLKVFSEVQLRRILFVWLLATAFMPIMLVIYEVLVSPVFKFAAICLALAYFLSVTIQSYRIRYLRKAFTELNLLVLFIMVLIWLHQLMIVQ